MIVLIVSKNYCRLKSRNIFFYIYYINIFFFFVIFVTYWRLVLGPPSERRIVLPFFKNEKKKLDDKSYLVAARFSVVTIAEAMTVQNSLCGFSSLLRPCVDSYIVNFQ